jgi:predicted DNA-binding transcriptional regulator AlpA
MPRANRRVPRRAGAYTDSQVYQMLGISERSFYRKLNSGQLSAPALVEGTKRRWWTDADVELARAELRISQDQRDVA